MHASWKKLLRAKLSGLLLSKFLYRRLGLLLLLRNGTPWWELHWFGIKSWLNIDCAQSILHPIVNDIIVPWPYRTRHHPFTRHSDPLVINPDIIRLYEGVRCGRVVVVFSDLWRFIIRHCLLAVILLLSLFKFLTGLTNSIIISPIYLPDLRDVDHVQLLLV